MPPLIFLPSSPIGPTTCAAFRSGSFPGELRCGSSGSRHYLPELQEIPSPLFLRSHRNSLKAQIQVFRHYNGNIGAVE